VDTSFSAEDLAFRDEVRAFFTEAYDDELQARLSDKATFREAVIDGQLERLAEQVMHRTMVANLSGIPAMSVPLHRTENDLPVGVQFIGRFADEVTLFKLAAQLEQAKPWRVRR